jgi:hypothetical protein
LAAQLAAADPAVGDRGDLAGLVKSSQRLRGWLDAFDARIALQAARLAEAGACEAPVAVLAGDGRRSTKDAEAAVGRAGVCDPLLPGVHDALAAGEVSSGHADTLARVTPDLDDAGRSQLQELAATLVESASTSSVEAFERQVRDLGRILSGDDGDWAAMNGCVANAACAAGWTATAGCATPTCNWIPKPTPRSPRRWTRRSPPNEPNPIPSSGVSSS